jgi:hypothetical protein
MKSLLASAAILSLLAAGTAVAGSKMPGAYRSDSPRMGMSDEDHRMGRSEDRYSRDKYDDDDRYEHMEGRDKDDDDREHSNRGHRGFDRMDTNGDGVIDRKEFTAHKQDRERS